MPTEPAHEDTPEPEDFYAEILNAPDGKDDSPAEIRAWRVAHREYTAAQVAWWPFKARKGKRASDAEEIAYVRWRRAQDALREAGKRVIAKCIAAGLNPEPIMRRMDYPLDGSVKLADDADRAVEILRMKLASLRPIRAARRKPVKRASKRQQRGPIAPNLFVWPGHEPIVLAPIDYRFMVFLWQQPNRRAAAGTIIEKVWNDSASDGAISSSRRRINSALVATGVGIRTKQGEWFIETPGKE